MALLREVSYLSTSAVRVIFPFEATYVFGTSTRAPAKMSERAREASVQTAPWRRQCRDVDASWATTPCGFTIGKPHSVAKFSIAHHDRTSGKTAERSSALTPESRSARMMYPAVNLENNRELCPLAVSEGLMKTKKDFL